MEKGRQKKESFAEVQKDTFFAQSLTWRNTKETNKMKFERERKVKETRKQEETKKRENRWK